MIIIPETPDEKKVVITVTGGDVGSALKAIGTVTNTIAIEEPVVEEPDTDNDAHWKPMIYGPTTYVLDGTHGMQIVDGILGVLRIHKPAGDTLAVHWLRN
jgi:hypothetical protein